MIHKLAGYTLAILGFTGALYFDHYKGSLISNPFLWLVLSVIIGVIGLLLITKAALNKTSKQERYYLARLKKLKSNGEKIILTKDNCEIKGNSYYEEKIKESLSMSGAADAIYDANRNYCQVSVHQSAIVYYYNSGNARIKMVSESYNYDKEDLEMLVSSGYALLYVDRFNKNDYIFELTR